MKAAESHTTQTHHRPQEARQGPFFREDGHDQAFFGGSQTVGAAEPFFGGGIQAKPTLGQPKDRYEQEADRTADEVVQRLSQSEGPDAAANEALAVIPVAPAITPVQRKCATCEAELDEGHEEGSAEEPLQRKPAFDGGDTPPEEEGTVQRKCAACAEKERLQAQSEAVPTPAEDLESRLAATKGGGSHLPEDTRNQMEGAMGADFSGVRVHTDHSAVQMSQELGAQAFTHGSDVYFNAGKYDAESREGQHLLAHELTHVVQQGGGNGYGPFVNRKEDVPNIQASWVDRVARRFLSGNDFLDFLVGVLAGIVEWFEQLFTAVIGLIKSAFEGNIMAVLAVIGIVIVIALAVAFPEIVLPILIVLGSIIGIGFLIYHLYRALFASGLTPYQRGKAFGKAIVEAILLIISVVEIIRFAKTYAQVAKLAASASLIQQLRYVRALSKYGNVVKTLELLNEIRDIEKTLELLEAVRNVEKALELLRLARSIDDLLELIAHTKISSLDQLTRLLRLSKIIDGAQLRRLLALDKVVDGTQLERLLGHAKISTSAELEALLLSTKLTDAVQLERLLDHVKLMDGAQLRSLLSEAKLADAGQLGRLLNHAKLLDVAQLQALLRDAKIVDGVQIERLLNHTKLVDSAQLRAILAEAKLVDATQLERLLNHPRVLSATQLQQIFGNAKFIDAGQFERILAQTGAGDSVADILRVLDEINTADRFLQSISHFGDFPILKSIVDHARSNGMPIIDEFLEACRSNGFKDQNEIIEAINRVVAHGTPSNATTWREVIQYARNFIADSVGNATKYSGRTTTGTGTVASKQFTLSDGITKVLITIEDADILHVASRHTYEFFALVMSNVKPSNSMFPVGTTQATLRNHATQILNSAQAETAVRTLGPGSMPQSVLFNVGNLEARITIIDGGNNLVEGLVSFYDISQVAIPRNLMKAAIRLYNSR